MRRRTELLKAGYGNPQALSSQLSRLHLHSALEFLYTRYLTGLQNNSLFSHLKENSGFLEMLASEIVLFHFANFISIEFNYVYRKVIFLN